MQRRIFRRMAVIALCTAVISAVVAGLLMFNFVQKQTTKDLKEDVLYIAAILDREEDNLSYLRQWELSYNDSRLTWVRDTGEVLFDSAVLADKMENHLDRPEIQEALETGFGQSQRKSDSWGRMTQYAAVKLEEGSIVRMARSQRNEISMILSLLVPFSLVMLPILLAVFFLSARLTKGIIQPLNSLELDSPLENNLNYPELAPLLTRLDKQNKLISTQMSQLRSEKEKLEAITENMQEAMVLLDEDGRVMSINTSAQALFGKNKDEVLNNHFLHLSRESEMLKATEKALSGVAEEAMVDFEGSTYLLLAGPVKDMGAVLIFLDVTEKQNAEAMRRDFSANVSHELKTPLTTISGYAEIMENGLARPEDMQGFAGRIHQEAQRLLMLINDIIRLSHLDEGFENGAFTKVDIWEEAKKTAARLQEKAAQCGVELILSGSESTIDGVPHVMDEIIFNLVDNAIRYNHEGGFVQCDVQTSAERVTLTVSDNGTGIPPEDREKVFERFYRVDKSHSKETGGTGLGLSIVKHGVKLHSGIMTLSSVEGKGTTIRIAFPRNI